MYMGFRCLPARELLFLQPELFDYEPFKDLRMMKTVMTRKSFHVLLCMTVSVLCAVAFNACSQEESDELGDTPFYQRYALLVNARGESVAYASFSASWRNTSLFIKLGGEQKILANGRPMNYDRLDDYHVTDYAYSLRLDDNVEKVTFQFVRNRTVTLENVLEQGAVSPIGLPADLKTIEAGKPVKWTGAPMQPDDNIEVFMELDDSPGYYSMVAASVTADGQGFVFDHLPDLQGKHRYKLTLRRMRKLPTTQNDRTAQGEMMVGYVDTKTVEIG